MVDIRLARLETQALSASGHQRMVSGRVLVSCGPPSRSVTTRHINGLSMRIRSDHAELPAGGLDSVTRRQAHGDRLKPWS